MDSLPRLIQWKGDREPPTDVLERLRAIHPGAELVDAGAEWWLGIVSPSPHRRATGARILARVAKQDTPHPDTVRLGQLAYQGFGLVAKYPQADGAMVEDFRRRCWQHEHAPDTSALYQAFRDEAGADERRRAAWSQTIRERAGEVMHILRGRTLLHIPNGLRGR